MRQLIAPIVFCSLTLIFFMLMADIFDNLQEFMQNKLSVGDILTYYLCFIPYSFSQTISWATLLGTVYLLVSFSIHNETLAMKMTGQNITRISIPILYLGFIIGLITFVVNDLIVPPTFLKAENIRREKIAVKDSAKDTKCLFDVTCFGRESVVYYIRTVDTENKCLEDVILLFFDKAGVLTKRVVAKEATWTENHWEFKNVTEYETNTEGGILGEPVVSDVKTFPEVRETLADFISAGTDKGFLRYKELASYVQKMKSKGLKTYAEEVELQHKLSYPWQSLIMMFIAIPFLMRTANRKVVAANVLISLGFVIAFHITNAISLALGKSGNLLPFISAWGGTFVFAIGSIFMIERANY